MFNQLYLPSLTIFHNFAALRNEKPKTQKRDERIKIDERMRRRKVFGNVHANGKVVTLAEAAKDYDKFPVVRDEDINWGLRVQASFLVFRRIHVDKNKSKCHLSFSEIVLYNLKIFEILLHMI